MMLLFLLWYLYFRGDDEELSVPLLKNMVGAIICILLAIFLFFLISTI